ncbi:MULTISPECIES: cyclic pyranopterin monophosphate synthase MoaC [Methanobacterium]|uniref:Probable cyclic pyranopterin monophosphate synthase n=1 Tax=Methanobacterium subterraneum TaxID=59277 RepID=A0A7K4DP12_9EURY|nr:MULTISPECIES: cyclic pyranopterin monophosphate synthase MoaC [Methanobacterium]AUB59157.1 molybdenum cofactor biosynthesis protein C [Methanobacterium sp. MZ-A1]NMO09624.1 cyclic pyranopterin monophosphate synthase MoaC [Methanobacterium subterraneum]
MDEKEFTHLTQSGVHMVEVGDKPIIKRTALAQGRIKLQKETIDLIEKGELKKGNVLTTAQIAAIQAVKNTPQMIPLCHPIPIGGVEVEFEVNPESIEVTVQVSSTGKTGVEMEAITGASVGLLTIWDMVKSVEKDENGQYPSTAITDIEVIRKEKIEL